VDLAWVGKENILQRERRNNPSRNDRSGSVRIKETLKREERGNQLRTVQPDRRLPKEKKNDIRKKRADRLSAHEESSGREKGLSPIL